MVHLAVEVKFWVVDSRVYERGQPQVLILVVVVYSVAEIVDYPAVVLEVWEY